MKRIALVGCGRISARHIEAVSSCKDTKITLVCDIDEKKASETGKRLGVPWITDYRKIKDVDVVSVLTPSGLHPRHAAEIAETTDVPYIVVEKPVSLTVREVYELFTRIDRAGKKLLPVYQNRYNPLVAFIKNLNDSGKLGKMFQFSCNVFWNRNDDYFAIDWHGTQELDGGVLYTQASHYVDMIHFFFGEIEESRGIGGSQRNLEVYDTLSAVCKFKSGVIGTINSTVSTYKKNYMTEFTIIAEKGTIRLSGTNLNVIDFWDVENMEKPDMDFTIDHVYGKGHDTLYKYIEDEKWEMFPSREDILSGIRLMEKLSYQEIRRNAMTEKKDIQFCDLKAQLDTFRPEMQKAVMDVIESTAFIKGPAVKKLEDELTAYLGGDVDSITCANGTEALLIALMALGVKPGDEVIIPDFTFIATGEVISLLGAVPVFCDVDPVTFNLDPSLIEDHITKNTVGIIPVSIFGQCADFESIRIIADKHNLWVMEDGAQSFGAEYKGKKSCSLTDIATTSFFPAKPLGCYGDGGAVFAKDKQLASKIRVIMNHGQTERYKHSVIGVNGRMDTLQAAVVSVKLRYFEGEIKKRNKAADLYTKLLKGIIETPEILPENLSVWAQYTVRHDNRENIRKILSEKGIPTAVHYPIPLHSQQAFAYLKIPGESCPVTSRLSNRVFSLPMHPYLSEEEITFIADTVKKAVING